MTYFKNIEELYLNKFDFPKFNILKDYRIKLLTENNKQMNKEMNDEINKIDIMIYLTLIIELTDKNNKSTLNNYLLCYPETNKILYGLIFQHTWLLNQDRCYKLEFIINDEKLNEYIKMYEPTNLTLFRQYDITKLFDEFIKYYINNNNNLIEFLNSNIWNMIKINLSEDELNDDELIYGINYYIVNEFIPKFISKI